LIQLLERDQQMDTSSSNYKNALKKQAPIVSDLTCPSSGSVKELDDCFI